MFEVSWGELIVVTGVGFALVGKKDLPRAAGMVGHRLGRLVGFLQGARARADTFAQQTELKQLHNELKVGLRELDAVKSEMAVAMSSRGRMMQAGGGMMSPGGSTITRTVLSSSSSAAAPAAAQQQEPSIGPSPSQAASTTSTIAATTAAEAATVQQALQPISGTSTNTTTQTILAPESQTIAAVAEEEWNKQGIGFKSRAERGVGLGYTDEDANNPFKSGSSILAHIYQQNLIFDQYDRVVQQQDQILQSKIDTIQKKQQQANNNNKPTSPKKGNE